MNRINMNYIKQKYNFLHYSDEKFTNIMQKIGKVVGKNNINFYQKVIEIFNSYIIKQLDDNNLDIILNYIYLNMKFNNDDNFESLKKLSDFFDELDYLPSFDQIQNIVFQSDKLWNYLKDNIDIKINEISMDSIIKLSDDDLILMIIQAFYRINKINIIDNYSDDAYPAFDSTKRCIKEYCKYKTLTRKEEQELFLRLQNGDSKAREIIIKSNLKLVIRIAKKYTWSNYGFNDLINEGVIGLIEAIKEFDLSKNTKFSTYATYHIKKQITLAIDYKSRAIRLPLAVKQDIKRLKETEQNLFYLTDKEPSKEEIATSMNLSLEKVENLIKASSINIISPMCISSDNDEEFDLLESVADENAEFEDELINNIFINELIEFLKSNGIKDRSIYVLCCRCDLFGKGKVLFEDIAKEFGITPQAVQAIQKKAITKIREIEGIESFITNPKKHM